MLARVVHVSVSGSHSSAAYTGYAGLSLPGPLWPPITSTLPFGRIVATCCLRGEAIGAHVAP